MPRFAEACEVVPVLRIHPLFPHFSVARDAKYRGENLFRASRSAVFLVVIFASIN
jgi:hypothetical protein